MGITGREGRILVARIHRPHRVPGPHGHRRTRRAGATSTIGLISHITVAPAWPAALLAKEVAGIDAVSGNRLTFGISVGGRPDDFLDDGLGPRGRGKRLDRDLEVYRSVWRGEAVDGASNALVPTGTRSVPLMFGGMSPASFERTARWGEGYIGPSVPVGVAAQLFEAAGSAWKNGGREGSPRLVAIVYYVFGDVEQGRANVQHHYSASGEQTVNLVTSGICAGPDAVKAYAELGVDEVSFTPALAELDEVERLAEVVL
ncbi:LLM class flavin-dependent oxidoreductase [Streptomyces sp. PSAA01]|uniref:LLM class flavin-dependent oxidoreductase n=1 Tax=Streptomyces sp. PSAA01 TaxID=2912762 RepID=UPI001F4744D2|nr:LLM class flavin-dependent oxidoreductase [Streptomyces sp. PSAA01]MCG0289766.1 LLM class flavin-dependent oxidoreductase [Streptomyces sp. PSAA01]